MLLDFTHNGAPVSIDLDYITVVSGGSEHTNIQLCDGQWITVDSSQAEVLDRINAARPTTVTDETIDAVLEKRRLFRSGKVF